MRAFNSIDGAAGASGLISAGDVIQEIDGGDVRNFSGAEIKDRLRQIGKVVTVSITFVIKTKETLVEQSGGVTGEYAAATHPDARGGGDVGGGSRRSRNPSTPYVLLRLIVRESCQRSSSGRKLFPGVFKRPAAAAHGRPPASLSDSQRPETFERGKSVRQFSSGR